MTERRYNAASEEAERYEERANQQLLDRHIDDLIGKGLREDIRKMKLKGNASREAIRWVRE